MGVVVGCSVWVTVRETDERVWVLDPASTVMERDFEREKVRVRERETLSE